MAVLRDFEHHLFISYAHLDNQPILSEQHGWISQFHRSLEVMLSMRLGRKADIWRDRKLAGNDIFADEIVTQFPKTALLVTILTPRYIESDWCTREVQEFCKSAEQSGGIVIKNKSRLIKVVKTPTADEGKLSSLIGSVLGYPFYIVDEEQTPLELDPVYGPDIAQKYALKVAKLAHDLAQQLKALAAEAGNAPKTAVPAVYLAECSWDQRAAREALESELSLHGYSVLPDRPLPRDEAGYVADVAAMLARAKLSIHLIGATYGAVPDGPSQASVVALQNDAAVARSKAAALPRLIWMQEGIDIQHADQQRFVETLHHSAELQFGADFLISDLETLKGAVHDTLKRVTRPQLPPQTSGLDGTKLVYLICDERDRKATVPIRKCLRVNGLRVELPLFDGDAATVRQNNQDLLATCDAVLVFYGAGDAAWKRTVDSDLRKINAYRRERPPAASHIYLADPATADKTDLVDLEEPNLIDGLAGFSEVQFDRLLAALRPG